MLDQVESKGTFHPWSNVLYSNVTAVVVAPLLSWRIWIRKRVIVFASIYCSICSQKHIDSTIPWRWCNVPLYCARANYLSSAIQFRAECRRHNTAQAEQGGQSAGLIAMSDVKLMKPSTTGDSPKPLFLVKSYHSVYVQSSQEGPKNVCFWGGRI